ncbi:hypothetical protein EG858_14780 [Enterococcus faecalis]|nr:hypothetical protein EG858_14780 [Enterococcus faecalis]
MVVVNFILQKRLPFLYGFFHLHKIFYTLILLITFNKKWIIIPYIFYKFMVSFKLISIKPKIYFLINHTEK